VTKVCKELGTCRLLLHLSSSDPSHSTSIWHLPVGVISGEKRFFLCPFLYFN